VDADTAAHRAALLRKWLYRLDGQATARQAAIIADFVRAGRAPRRRPLALGPSLRGATKRLAQMAVNTALGRGFDLPLAPPRRHDGVEINELGYVDRLTRQPDVEAWCARLRSLRRESPIPAAELSRRIRTADGAR
jgi:hypothetical protein